MQRTLSVSQKYEDVTCTHTHGGALLLAPRGPPHIRVNTEFLQ